MVKIRGSLRFDGILGEQPLCVKLKALAYQSEVLIETYNVNSRTAEQGTAEYRSEKHFLILF